MPGSEGTEARLRDLFLRATCLVYLVAFAIAWRQAPALYGTYGLTPLDQAQQLLVAQLGSGMAAFDRIPGLFWLWPNDDALRWVALVGMALALLGMAGVHHALGYGLMWLFYLSFCHAGQLWHGFGWETMLLETGVLCVFSAPVLSLRVRPVAPERWPSPDRLLRWLRCWLLFRLMFGSGMIKWRGDPCWRELSCLQTHFETQPNPHPLSPIFHHLPAPVLEGGLLFNHLVELILPFFLLFSQTRNLAVAGTILFQIFLILSGNLAFFNWLTIAVALGCLEPGRWPIPARPSEVGVEPLPFRRWLTMALLLGVVAKSVEPVKNLLSENQRMNQSYDVLHLVNSYGAFGSVGESRLELVIEGSAEEQPETWKEYVFPCKPGPVERRPCWVTPYHLRLDWQLWFAAMGNVDRYPFVVHMVWKILHNDPGLLALIEENPFPDRPPTWIRVRRFRYQFARSGPDWWERELVGGWLRPVRREDTVLLQELSRRGWEDRLAPGSWTEAEVPDDPALGIRRKSD
jgi:Lipase maturation factor